MSTYSIDRPMLIYEALELLRAYVSGIPLERGLTVARTERYIEELLAQTARSPRPPRAPDVRGFLSSEAPWNLEIAGEATSNLGFSRFLIGRNSHIPGFLCRRRILTVSCKTFSDLQNSPFETGCNYDTIMLHLEIGR